MGLYTEQVLPRVLHVVMARRLFGASRPLVLGAVSGRVLEIGFGSGLNLPHYRGGVRELLALEPSAVAWRLAQGALSRVPFPVRLIGSDAGEIPLEDACVDAVVSTWTLCTVPDVAAVLAEVRRVLRPGGRLHFIEHGLSPDPRVARWQARLEPLHGRIAGGCRLTRHLPRLVESSDLELERVEELDLPGPPVATHCFLGVARRGLG